MKKKEGGVVGRGSENMIHIHVIRDERDRERFGQNKI